MHLSGKVIVFARTIPNIIASIIDDIGLFEKPKIFIPIYLLASAPIYAIARATKIPGIFLKIIFCIMVK